MKKKKSYNIGVLCSFLALILCILSLIYYAITKKVPEVGLIVLVLVFIGTIFIGIDSAKNKKKKNSAKNK